MTHLLLTRFAVLIRRTLSRGPQPLTSGWLARRFALFEQYCLPSVQAQTAGQFHWWIYVDSSVDAAISDRLRAYDARIEVRTDSHKALPELPDERVLTTRLDSDDAIPATYCEALLTRADKSSLPTLLDCPSGWYLDHGSRRIYQGRGTAFKALVCAGGPAQPSLYARSADVIADAYKTETVTKRPSWLRVVHGGNLTNQFRPKGLTHPLKSLRGPAYPWVVA